jgi:mannose-6-phosphate isomerase-like protein (cupin superfamily)
MAVNKINVKAVIPQVKKPWTPIILASVENYDVKLVEFKGEYFWHKHDKHDEFMYVWRGGVSIDVKNGKAIDLKASECALIEKGTIHRSRSARKSLVLVFGSNTALSDFVKV